MAEEKFNKEGLPVLYCCANGVYVSHGKDTSFTVNQFLELFLNFAGIQVFDYKYPFGFMASSGSSSIKSKMHFPFRYLISKISPWLLSKTMGGASLMVIAITFEGLSIENNK